MTYPAFHSTLERLACKLHTARMDASFGEWQIAGRFNWPETREEWQRYQHAPHSQIILALAQAKAVS